MNATGKFIFGTVFAAVLASAATAAYLGARAEPVDTIHLAAVIVTPASAEPETIALAAVTVTPSAADRAFVTAQHASRLADGMDNLDEPGAELLLQAVATLGPGQFLDTGAALRAFNALAFASGGR